MDSSYFYQQLLDYLIGSHPDLIEKIGEGAEEFILSRSKAAGLSLEGDLRKGIHMDIAREAAFEILYEGLKFSKYEYVLNVFEENYPQNYSSLCDNNQLQKQVLNYVDKCAHLFEKYNAGDDFAGDNKLYCEVLGTIEIEMGKDAVQ